MDSVGLKTRNLRNLKPRTMSSNINEQLHFKSVSVDVKVVQTVSPYAPVSIRPIGVVRTKKHRYQIANAAVAKAAESRDAGRPTSRGEAHRKSTRLNLQSRHYVVC